VAPADGWTSNQRSRRHWCGVVRESRQHDTRAVGFEPNHFTRGIGNWVSRRRRYPARRFTVRGLNTAATLWCSAAVGCMSGSGLLLQAAVAAFFVTAANALFRPLAAIIDRQPSGDAEIHTHYVCSVTCRGSEEAYVRTALLRALSNPAITLQALDSNDLEDTNKVRVKARLVVSPRNDALLEQVVSQLSLEPSVSAVKWRTVEENNPLDMQLSTKEQAE
jgi:hypothetical protein